MILNNKLTKTEYYSMLSNLNFIESKTWNERIGIKNFKWVVENTFFKFFNQKIKVDNRRVDLIEIRNEMTLTEISHLIAFVFVAIFSIYKIYSVSLVFGLSVMIPNFLMNLYPSLLHQENERRIDKLINRHKL